MKNAIEVDRLRDAIEEFNNEDEERHNSGNYVLYFVKYVIVVSIFIFCLNIVN